MDDTFLEVEDLAKGLSEEAQDKNQLLGQLQTLNEAMNKLEALADAGEFATDEFEEAAKVMTDTFAQVDSLADGLSKEEEGKNELMDQ